MPPVTASATAPAIPPTRQRILDAALERFAAHGYAGTSIAELERAAGLSPGSGALYRHFKTKRQLLEAALQQRMEAIEEMRSRFEFAPLGDLRSELLLIGRWGLAELRRERELVRIMMREGEDLPEVIAAFRKAVVDPGVELALGLIRRYTEHGGNPPADPEATAEVLVASLVGFALQGFMLGRGFSELSDERFVTSWAESSVAIMESERKGNE